ncbi:MAG: GerAB/ArcD/ProY family transporter [Bacillota bacterium]
MHREIRYGSWSLGAAGATVLIAQSFHPTMLGVLWAGGTAAWLSILLAGLLSVALSWPVAVQVGRTPGGSLISLARAAGGGAAAFATAVAVGGLLVYHSGLVLREASEMAVTVVFPHTPQTFAMVALLLGALYAAIGGIDSIVILCRAFLPILLLVTGIILVGSMGWGEVRLLLPLFGPGPGPLLLRSPLVAALYSPLLFLLAGADRLHDRRELWRAGLIAAAITMVVFALVKALLVMAFPLPLGEIIAFPLHAMARLVIGGRFFERIEALWLFFWVYATGCHLGALLHTASAMYAEAVGFPNHRPAVLPMLLAAGTIGLFPPDIGRAIAWHVNVAPVAVGIAFGLPLLLALVSRLRQRRAAHG